MKFGLSQIQQETPAIVKTVFGIVLYLSAAAIIVVNTITQIPAPVKVTIISICGEAVALVHAFSALFGVPVTDTNASSSSNAVSTPAK